MNNTRRQTPRPIAAVVGVVLAGGCSSRFGGNKALVMLDGRPLIKHVTDTVTKIFSSCLLVTNSPATYKFLNLPMTGDLFADAGPLAGIHAALQYVRRLPRRTRCFIVGCDMPLLTPPLIRLLCDLSYEDDSDAVIPRPAAGRAEPLCGIYHIRALPLIEESLRKKTRKIGQVLNRLQVRYVSRAEILTVVPDLTSFHNVNRTTDLTALQRPCLSSK